jgi:aminoglycoside phosphotransferase (APT) family kinase protein
VTESSLPRTSTRDPDELRARLLAWLETTLPSGATPRVGAFDAPSTNGMSSETVLLDAAWNDHGIERREEMVVRIAPDDAAVPVFPEYDLARQARTMQLVAEHTSVPVPHVLWVERDAAPLGAPFFVMRRVEGRVPPDIMPYTFGSWLSEATDADRRRLQDATVAVLAQLHAIEDAPRRFAFLELPHPEPTALRRHVAAQWDYYQWVVADGLRSPLLERCFAWLRERWPTNEGPTGLSWGDSRIGNVLYRDFEPAAVLDWEMAALGPPEIDLAWLIYMHRFFDDLAVDLGLPGLPGFLRRDDVAADYEARNGYAPRDLDFFTMYAALRHGIIMFARPRREIPCCEAAPPAEVDDMITHRRTLEAMLAGDYWANRG